jgi:BCD family chlorophyll transporter-like MFS transporter
VALFRTGSFAIGFGGGLFSVGMLTAAMLLAETGMGGLALGAWGAVQATAAGVATAFSGTLRDSVSVLAGNGRLGEAVTGPAAAYGFVYHIEIFLLFATLVAVGPLVRRYSGKRETLVRPFGLAEYPG